MGSRNPIIRRVRRHAVTATLFRAVRPALSPRPAEPAMPVSSRPTSPPAARACVAALLPAGVHLPTGHVVGSVLPSDVVGTPLEPSAQRTSAPSTRSRVLSATDSPNPSPPVAPLEDADGTKTLDAEWPRLEAIFRKHRERQAADGVPSQADVPSVPIQREPAHRETPSVHRETAVVPAEGQPERSEPELGSRRTEPDERHQAEVTAVRDLVVEAADEAPSQGPPVQPSPEEPEASQPVSVPEQPARATPADRMVETDPAETILAEAHHPGAQTQAREAPAADVEAPVAQEVSVAPLSQGDAEPSTGAGEPTAAPVPEASDRAQSEPSMPLQQEIRELLGRSEPAPLVQPRSPQEGELDRQDVFREDTSAPTLSGDDTDAPTGMRAIAEQEHAMPEPEAQPVPLQAVWSVQRLEAHMPTPIHEPPATVTSASTQMSEAEQPKAISDEVPRVGESRTVQRDGVPGKLAASSVDIIPPRQPRPEARRRQGREAFDGPRPEPLEGPRPEPAGGQERVIQRTGEHRPSVAPDGAVGVPRAATSPAPSVQLRRDDGPEAAQGGAPERLSEPEWVQTDIGPLPSDLWHILGQSPPQRSWQGAVPEAGQAEPTPSVPRSDATVMRTTTDVEVRPAVLAQRTAKRAEARGATPTLVQRQAMPQAPPNQMSGGPSGPPVQGEEPETPEEDLTDALDTDELARRVYARIRRRLSVEWERGRWRV